MPFLSPCAHTGVDGVSITFIIATIVTGVTLFTLGALKVRSRFPSASRRESNSPAGTLHWADMVEVRPVHSRYAPSAACSPVPVADVLRAVNGGLAAGAAYLIGFILKQIVGDVENCG